MDPLYVRLMDRLYVASIWVAGTAIFFMSLIIPWGVFTRYVLGTGSQWPEPIAILLMMSFTFIGAAAAYRAGAHIAVTMFTERLPASLQHAGDVLVHALMVVICLFVVFYGTRLCIETMGQSIAELPWLPVGVTYAAIPIGSAITLLFVIEHLVFGSQAGRPLVRHEAPAGEPAVDGAR
ncbi:MAG: TRAP transporter small permease [Burkholderiales bacterium]|nr:MAG: TRAP transporter small permease [Burkholderiales bacterium]